MKQNREYGKDLRAEKRGYDGESGVGYTSLLYFTILRVLRAYDAFALV